MGPTRLVPDRAAYIRTQAWIAALAMAAAMAVLWALGNPHVWTGAVAGLAGIGARGWYLASEELAAVWEIDGATLCGPGGRRVPLDRIAQVRTLGSMVQIVTTRGDKHLIKYRADPQATKAAIEAARARGQA